MQPFLQDIVLLDYWILLLDKFGEPAKKTAGARVNVISTFSSSEIREGLK